MESSTTAKTRSETCASQFPLFSSPFSIFNLVSALLFAFSLPLSAQNAVPPPARELRGSWIATVRNINWPSEPGLPVAKQKEQLLTLIDSAAKLRLNAL
ncbi:MAG: hypothetical protein ACK5TH_09085, partial [Prosthecobacter sp.]